MAFIYATDLDSFLEARALYFDFSELPFSLALNHDELLNNISSFSEPEYSKKISSFYNDICGLYKGGNASEYVADLILSKTI